MFELLQNTRTLAVLCAFSTYDAPTKAGRRQLQTLERVQPTFDSLKTLLCSERFIAAGIQAVVLLNQSQSELMLQFEEIRDAMAEQPGVNMVVFWSGHGNIDEKSFRLAIRNTYDPIKYEDGIGLDEIIRKSGVRQVGTWTIFLDACYAGEGLTDVVDTAHGLLKSEAGTLRGYGALCSSAPFEKSRDSAFLETVVELLAKGPSDTVRNAAANVGGGGMFNPNNKLLNLSDLFNAVSAEYVAQTSKYRSAKPWRILGGDVDPWIFPNPQYQENQPSRLVENAYRAIARNSDLESHFFPKALGIDNLESGWHFTGRVDATRSILGWMARPSLLQEDRLYVLAAGGGTGKSALLGRLIALTDHPYRDKARRAGWNEALDREAGTLPKPDCIDAALSLRSLTPQTLAEHLAGLLGTGSFDSIEAFVQKATQSYQRQDGAAPCIVLDALDEALEPSAIVFRVVHPVVNAGWKVLVATRRSAKAKGANDLIAELGTATVFELDHDKQSWNDIYTYAQGRLRSGPKLAAVTEPAARLIADRAESKFLFARIATSSLLRSIAPITLDVLPALVANNAAEALAREVSDLDAEFQCNFDCDGGGATAMLMALAWCEGDGVPIRDGIWAAMAEAVGSLKGPNLKFQERHILWLLREAGRFIQEAGDGEQAVYRLFHKSLVDYFRPFTIRADPLQEALDERIAGTLVSCIRVSRDWSYTNPYLVRHIPAHLALRPEQKGLNKLLLNFDWIQARLNLSGIQALLSDYRLCHSAYPATARLHRTLTMVAHILREHPDQLIPQLLGRIAPGVPDITPLLNGQPGANYGLPPPSQEGLNESAQQLMPQLPGLNIEHHSVDLIGRTLSLDSLLERAKASLRSPRWVPELGGLVQAGALVYTLQGHEYRVTSVALSADGLTVASGSYDCTVRLWDAQTGQSLRALQGHENIVTCVALSADGRTVASGSNDCTVRLWDAQTGQVLRTLQVLESNIYSVALSADGRTVASGSDDCTVRLWDAQTGQVLRTLQGHESWITSVALSADGRTVVSGSPDKTVRLWDAQTGQSLCILQGHDGWVTSVALSADGLTVASGSRDRTVRLWNGQTGQVLHTLSDHDDEVRSVAMSADGRTVASGCEDCLVRLWDAQTGQVLRMLQSHEDLVTSVALSVDGRTVVSGSWDTAVRLWDARTGRAQRMLQSHEDLVISVALSADGRTVVSGGRDNTVRLWDAQTGQALCILRGHEGWVTGVALSADGRTVVSGGWDNTVRLWDAQTGQALRIIRGHEGWVTSVALSADGLIVVSGSHDRTVCLWDAQTGQVLRTLPDHKDAVSSVAISADGHIVVSGCWDKMVRLWDVQSGQLLRAVQGHEGSVYSVALSADGSTVVSGGWDTTVRLWDAQSGQEIRTLKGHENTVGSLALSADGSTLVSGSEDNTVRLWDTETGRCVEILTLDAAVNAVALSMGGRQPCMAVASGRSVVRLARLPGVASRTKTVP
jgi:WD40 repeat protein